MSLKSSAAKVFAKFIHWKSSKWILNPYQTQAAVFEYLITKGSTTAFGKDHAFDNIKTHQDFIKAVPIRDYEELRPYVDKAVLGEKDVLWPGKPTYFAKTSGTTSGAKYIPITKESIKYQIEASRDAILSYINETGKANFVDGKMIFLQGSPILEVKNGVNFGRLSGISAHYVPSYLQKNRLPSWETNCIEDWETKVETIVTETKDEDMTLIAGIPSWVQMYFEKLKEKTNQNVGVLFKSFELFIYGGVNYEPYRKKFETLIGRRVPSIELFPASEGFFAFQNSQKEGGMLLLLNSGIFYEFVKVNEFHLDNRKRITLKDVVLHVDYVMIISTNAGLWAYNLGDTIRFTSLKPYKILVSGRIKHFISAFGEHVIGKEVEEAMLLAAKLTDARINEFTVAPMISPATNELPYHEWFVEFEKLPADMDAFILTLDVAMQNQNSYYFDLISGNVLQRLKITAIRQGGFKSYMKSIGKLGGQNKLQRLSNDRSVVDELVAYKAD